MTDGLLSYGGRELALAEVVGTEDEIGLDVSAIKRELGVYSFDPGLGNSAEAQSAITYIDGVRGILRYRGYPIEELAAESTFLETAYLLILGELPDGDELKTFMSSLSDEGSPPPELRSLLETFPAGAHPMQMLGAAVGALGAYHVQEPGEAVAEYVKVASSRLLSQVPILTSWIARIRNGQPSVRSPESMDYVSSFLFQVFADEESYLPQQEAIDALDTLLILHADHGQNCSTTAARLVGSSGADIYASMSAAVHALSGPKHGGANQEVLDMLARIHRDFTSVDAFIKHSKSVGRFRLAGFGHRVYKTFDPRATFIKQAAQNVFDGLKVADPLLDIAMELEATALSDGYFIDRQLYPNVDFYSGLIYRALGFPVEMFTTLFALGRLPGWIAHWREGSLTGEGRIYRPRQVYTGPTIRSYVPMAQR